MASGLRIGRYELGERLGTGGFGVVYLAIDTDLGRELAIKVLRPEYQTQPDVVARFLKEARAAAKIDHPGIVTVFECGTISDSGTAQDGNAYIAMELLRGCSLTQHLEQRGPLPLLDAILIARQVCGALAVAHAAGIVHRDLKPDNVFLLSDPLVQGGFRIKILDFGVAKLAEPKQASVNTHSQMMLGTPKYMSPEQARSPRAVDQRTDVYTLGCMLYEMLTGQAPYEGPGAIDMIIQHATAPVPSVRALVHEVPEAIEQLIRTMMGKDPDERPDSMQAIEQALVAIQNGSVPPPIPPRVKPPPVPPPIPREMADTEPNPVRPPPRPTPPPPPLAPPVRPTPQPPVRPSAGAVETIADSAPFPTAPRAQLVLADDEVTDPRRPPAPASRAPLFAGVAIIATVLVAGIGWFALRRDPQPARASKNPTTATVDPKDARAVEQECHEYEKAQYWKELKECSDRLKSYDRALGQQLWSKADDEAANEQKWKGVQKYLAEGAISKARDLVKRIGEGSVYTERAHKLLEEAEATSSPASP